MTNKSVSRIGRDSGPKIKKEIGMPFGNAERCNTWLDYYENCIYGCCDDNKHSGYDMCCNSYYDTDSIRHVLAIGPIIGIVVGCVILVITVISIIVCCVCCSRNSRGQQGQTFTSAASGPYVMNQMPYGAQMGQAHYGQQPYPAQPPPQTGHMPPLQTGHMAPGTTVVNHPGMQGPTSYGKSVDN
ncbi:hypothetical protein MAR_001450 [Mya arenaria]|uniref:Uncharacterized protein n=1 Tax=Mya arenaria TaxID=6604 RepID=A0ABY7FBU0_MYAAR|nr:hypothetical protein MAR_001450 [Mya arenaria]